MNCWEILGIEPTRDRDAIDQAYEQQRKFATGEELVLLQKAYQEASGQPVATAPISEKASEETDVDEADLTTEEQQIVREVCIQIKALLNDSRRSADEGIWKAILTEPPADKSALRSAIAANLEAQIRPMADNGSFPPSVVAFLGDWFGWNELLEKGELALSEAEYQQAAQQGSKLSAEEDAEPPMTSFWPAVIGWIVALAVLAAFFEGIFGG
ncbi:J domain-containing protein [Marinobacter sp. CHS3-4]|uniref:J domain-containing protein n=1 Tax=Marinobacter sp. CHS3-4 TaxID=3045174 RepID=UPI0024B5E5B4|nr:J domain-containing protein [Marinobacter sp. CHS3-4]MDI9245307.1 J domain-containing protein [Marinobacter sp. CHS3-4]